jgi:hypothetical protein
VKSWIEFWDSDHAIYVSERHKLLHARAVGRDIVRHLPGSDAVVLDYGCGEALYAPDVAARCGRLILCEAADGLRQNLARRVAGESRTAVLSPREAAELAPGSVHLVVANSLVQYLQRDELSGLLGVWRSKIAPGGALVVADVIPPDATPVSDAAALLRFAWDGGFLLAAVGGLVRTALSDYGEVRKQLGFATYRERDFVALLEAAGFRAERVRPNFGHNQGRMTFRAVPG